MEESGPLSLPPETVVDMFERTVRRFPNHTALAVKRGGEWKKWTYRKYYQDCRTAAKALIKIGVEEFHAIGIIGFVSPEWIISDMAAIMTGGLATGIYPTNSLDIFHYVALSSSANVIVVEDNTQLQKILKVWRRLPSLKAVVQYSGQPQEKRRNVYSWSEFMALGSQVSDVVLDRRIRALAPNKCCTLYYPSRAVGNPLGVMISHDQFVWYSKILKSYLEMDEGKEIFLSHFQLSGSAFAKLFDIYLSIILAGTTYLTQPCDVKDTDSFIETLKEVRPTLFFSSPRDWEKIYEKLKIDIGNLIDNAELLAWARKIGYKGNMNKMIGLPIPPDWDSANHLVFQKIRKYLGLDQCKITWTGGALFSRHLSDYFMSIGILVLDTYSMSELVGPSNLNIEKCFRIGAIGISLPGMKIKILNPDKQGNGEICHCGRGVFMGYLNMKVKTLEILDNEGYLHSGDCGKIDKNGFVFLAGRFKELIITSDGLNIEPAPIEDIIKRKIPLLNNCILIGEEREFLSILLTLKVKIDSETGRPTEKLTDEAIKMCQALGSTAATVQDVKGDEKLKHFIQQGIDRYNQNGLSPPQQIHKWTVLETDFSIPGGELGLDLKLRRDVISKRYKNVINRLYNTLKLTAKY